MKEGLLTLPKKSTPQQITEAYKKFTRSTYYLLPLLNLEVNDFGYNLINTYFSNLGYKIYTRVKSLEGLDHVLESDFFETKLEEKEGFILVFNVPEKHKVVYDNFKSNKMHKSSQEVIRQIYSKHNLTTNLNGLYYCIANEPDDYRYMLVWGLNGHILLDGSPNPLLKYWENETGIKLPEGYPTLPSLNLEVECLDHLMKM